MKTYCRFVLYCAFVFFMTLPDIYAKQEEKLMNSDQTIAIFAGGCFWCMEHDFYKVIGVIDVVSGYTGGKVDAPSYESVSAGATGHHEAVEIQFDPKQITYEQLLDIFWHNVDPFDDHGQFCDKGSSYRAAIFYLDESQQKQAEESKKRVEKELGKVVVTQILPASQFYPAEEYHQDYAKKNPIRYKFYRFGCGRDNRLKEIWGPPKKNKAP